MKFVKFGFARDAAAETVFAGRRAILRMPHVRLCAALEPEQNEVLIGECFGVSFSDEADAEKAAESIRALPGIAFAEAQ